ncbi:MAG: CinA family protein [Fuerstiella sp.]|nr:CinA family protein [Fuerstiella sp.]MCP4858969.1 CinA family protein [Fuerstiella sp.]
MDHGIVSLDGSATELVRKLIKTGQKIVFAESCTAGLLAATMGRIPGVSSVLAGSAVVYQEATKHKWLNISEDLLRDPGPVSEIVSELMAQGVLADTPHATIAASVTGHLGPDAPQNLDGIAWSTVAVRRKNEISLHSRRLLLSPSPTEAAAAQLDGLQIRHARQQSAAQSVLRFCLQIASAGCGFS